MRMSFRWGMTTLAACAVAACVGCGAGKAKLGSTDDPEVQHIQKVGEWSGEYAKEHKKEAPKSIEALKSWAKKNKGASDEDFVSTRDHQEYKLMKKGNDALVYEATGENHQVYTVLPGGFPTKSTPEALQYMSMGSGPPAAPDGTPTRGARGRGPQFGPPK